MLSRDGREGAELTRKRADFAPHTPFLTLMAPITAGSGASVGWQPTSAQTMRAWRQSRTREWDGGMEDSF